MPKRKTKKPVTMRTVSIKIDMDSAAFVEMEKLQAAYAAACNLLVPTVVETRCWNSYALHAKTYTRLRAETPLGSQLCCNVLRTVTAAYKAMRSNGEIDKDGPVPAINFKTGSVHLDKRTFTLLKDDVVSINTLTKNRRIKATLMPGAHQRKLMTWGTPKEAELILRKDRRGVPVFRLNLVLEKEITHRTTGIVLGVDVGENKLAATSTGKVFGGEKLRHDRDGHLALRRRLQSNGSKSSTQLLRKVSGKEARHVRHVNHETSKAIVTEALAAGARAIALEDLTDIRRRIKAGKRMRGRLHRWAFRQLQDQIAYKAAEHGIQTVFVNPAYTSKSCCECGQIGLRVKHRFTCKCGSRAHSDVNAARNHARLGERALSPMGDVNRPDVGEVSHDLSR